MPQTQRETPEWEAAGKAGGPGDKGAVRKAARGPQHTRPTPELRIQAPGCREGKCHSVHQQTPTSTYYAPGSQPSTGTACEKAIVHTVGHLCSRCWPGTVQGRRQAQSSLWGSGESRCPRPAVAGARAEGARTLGQQARLPLPCTLTAEYLGNATDPRPPSRALLLFWFGHELEGK